MPRRLFTNALPYIGVCITILLVYFPVLGLDFQRGWDDGWMVMNHYTIFGFTWDNLKAVFTEFFVTQYGPINEVVYMAIYAAFGYNPMVYHLYPLLLHMINSCLVLILIQQLIHHRTDTITARRISVFTALLFAIHPLNVESIAWISASKIPLYTFFVLLAMLSYIRYVRTGKSGLYIGAWLLFVCSFGSKEQSVVLPATLLLLDWLLGRTSVPCGEDPEKSFIEKRSWGYLLLEKLPFILFALFAGLCTYANQSGHTIDRWAGYPFGQRMVFACYSVLEYLGKLIFPVNLLYLYPFPIAPGLPLPVRFFIYPGIIAAAIIFFIKILKRKDWPVIFGLLFFLVNISLMLHVIAMSRFSIIADRYAYLPSVGIFFIIAWYGVQWIQKMSVHSKKWMMAVVVCYLLYLGGYAHYRTYAWKDSDTLKKEFRELLNESMPEQNEERENMNE
ncbi:MAG: hypothetical protein LBQ60_07285 [Bacteroidales bacterium]|jgi:hypothetical protein|nr:hypothetical protein [Bacteroidales bacterium]